MKQKDNNWNRAVWDEVLHTQRVGFLGFCLKGWYRIFLHVGKVKTYIVYIVQELNHHIVMINMSLFNSSGPRLLESGLLVSLKGCAMVTREVSAMTGMMGGMSTLFWAMIFFLLIVSLGGKKSGIRRPIWGKKLCLFGWFFFGRIGGKKTRANRRFIWV